MTEHDNSSLKFQLGVAFLAFAIVTSGFVGVMSYHEVPAGHIGVETEWSAVNGEVHESGQAWTIPIKEGLWVYDTRPQTYTMSQTENEGQKTRNDEIKFKAIGGIRGTADITIRYRLTDDPEAAKEFAREWRSLDRAEEKMIRPTVISTFKEESGGIQPDAIMTEKGRERLEDALAKSLQSQFGNLVLEAVQVRRVEITDKSYMRSLRQKKKAEKQVEVEKIRIQKEKKIAKQKEVQAKADAKVIRIKGEALRKNPSVLDLRRIEALKEGNTIYVPTGSSNSLMLTKEVSNSTQTNNTTA